MKVVVLLATTLKRFTDDDGFTLACTTITSRSRSRYRESLLCVLCFVVENERSDDDDDGRFFHNKFLRREKCFFE